MNLRQSLSVVLFFQLLPMAPAALSQVTPQGQSSSGDASGENIEELPAPAPFSEPEIDRSQRLSQPASDDDSDLQSPPLRSILEPTPGLAPAKGFSPDDRPNAPLGSARAETDNLRANSYESEINGMGTANGEYQLAIPRLRTPLGYEVLLQGPLHEAFGFHVPRQAMLPRLAPVAPPPSLREQRPAPPSGGKNLQWIGGYWTWNDLLDDFVWVPGMYREVPPGRVWREGYWSQAEEGDQNYVRVVGYWAEPSETTQYLPPPPIDRARGPSSKAGSADSFWLPGHWEFKDGDYQWRKGFWTKQQSDWIWQPSRYVWTPKGFVFSSGFWDYEPTIRGLPYAPVHFPNRVEREEEIRFVPEYQIAEPSYLMAHLFVHANDPHFYWGDYYGQTYLDIGFLPWYRDGAADFPTASLIGYYEWKFSKQRISVVQRMAERQQQWLAGSAESRQAFGPLAAFENSEISPTAGWPSDFEGLIRGRNTSRIGGQRVPVLLAASLTAPTEETLARDQYSRRVPRQARPSDVTTASGVQPSASALNNNVTRGANTPQIGSRRRMASPSRLPASPPASALERMAAERAAILNRNASTIEAMRNLRLGPASRIGPVIPTPFGPVRPPAGFQPPFGPPTFNPLGSGGLRPTFGERRRFGRNR